MWARLNNIPQVTLGELLTILRNYYPPLPKNPRTLLSTGKVHGIKEISGGSCYHFGIESCLIQQLKSNTKLTNSEILNLQINTDGLPLFKSSSTQLWPILDMVQNMTKPKPLPCF